MITPRQAAEAMRAACAAKAQAWLKDRSSVLAKMRTGYLEASRKGAVSGRPTNRPIAAGAAQQFDERASAVQECADNVERELLAISVAEYPDGEQGVPQPFGSWREAYDSAVAARAAAEEAMRVQMQTVKLAIEPLQFASRAWLSSVRLLKPAEKEALTQAQTALIAIGKISA